MIGFSGTYFSTLLAHGILCNAGLCKFYCRLVESPLSEP